MQPRNVPFHIGVSTEDRVSIFVQDGEFDVDEMGSVYHADLYTTDQVLVMKIKDGQGRFIATNLNLRDDIVAGKPVWISVLNSEYGYVLPQARLEFDLLS